MDDLTIEIFSGETDYQLNGFDCTEPSLNAFLIDHLRRQHNSRILRAYILRTAMPEARVLGYYTLSGSSFEKEQLPSKSQRKSVPYHNVPSITLGRLAVDKSLQGCGWGATLVAHAMKIVYGASQAVGVHGLFVEALNENAKSFYISLGFIALTGTNERALFYPTKSIEKLFENQ
ncbi:acetyltransferase (GNAT) family protein [Enterobacter sp. BIGb0383]|uniref:GNAT family N-acetyltransferase n=1 Tax=unclassified Enterobacter TaxID=2608935 RepID=UPI000F490BC6|nr:MULTISPECIES: GNAT family N-acetyltransferase [unclassified Enterobacter]ROP49905.1 acetyltransferase (GNAT) family protein [Enterobacter sp. BIGb0383]ROS06353.1 acetyltransferase (GNAT) family protein [Enterobacter sp. BIGb0359]